MRALCEILASGRSRVLLRDRTPEERVALALASDGAYAKKAAWRDKARAWRVMASVERATGAKLLTIGNPGAARLALEEARALDASASAVEGVLRLFPLPPDFWLA